MQKKSHIELLALLFRCYKKCLRNKNHIRLTTFHLHHEHHLNLLAMEIFRGQYKPKPSSIFVVTHPKNREIIAANIKDRVVHHLIYDHMEPYWERRFDSRSYACRPGKGTLNSTHDLRNFIAGYQAHSRHPLWYLKVDVRAFFPSIDRAILASLILPKINDPMFQKLVEITINHNPTAPGNFNLRCSPHTLALIPHHKSLFTVPPGKGIPIGNLTSQFFANIYLNELDQFLARRIKPRPLYWQRYVDDIVCFDTNPKNLKKISEKIDSFIYQHLALSLNPKKTVIQPLSKGLDHLGYFHLPNRIYPRKRVIKAVHHRIQLILRSPTPLPDIPTKPNRLLVGINSYLGHFSHANAHRMRKKICLTLAAASSGPDMNLNISVAPDFSSMRDLNVKLEREKIMNQSIAEDFDSLIRRRE